ncbi:MAG: tetratricopeptide repeat protein [Polyangiaceae bacterium]|nr:tetratricopeptide repeat protein [Polyangiaceae bacterium]
MTRRSTIPRTGQSPRLRAPGVWLAATCSGMAALGYEICWSRALVVPLGNSTDATTLVLATFMLGMAGGAWLAGSWSERVRSTLRIYAAAEFALGLFALAAPELLASLSGIPVVTWSVGSARLGMPFRTITAVAVLVLPCLAMGASLPLLVRSLTGPGVPVRARISLLYAANTLGAAGAACWTGFSGIATLGIARCSAVLALGSFAAAALAAVVARWGTTPDCVAPVSARDSAIPPPRPVRNFALVAAFVSGLVMLAAEVVWTRMLTFVFGHDTYAFSALLAVVLCGITLGGFAHRFVSALDQTRVVGTLLACLGGCLALTFWCASTLVIERGRDPFALAAIGSLSTSAWLGLCRELGYAAVLVLAPSMLAGALYPATCSLYAGSAADTGRSVGRIGLVNGVGSAVGTLAAALGAVSAAGIQGVVLGLASIAGATALGALAAEDRRGPVFARACTVVPVLLTIGILARLPGALPQKVLLSVVGPRHQKLLHYEEARTGTVAVIESRINAERQLLINGVNEVTTRLVHDQSFKLLGHLGPLLHPRPRTAVMICLGAGLSAGAALAHPLERLDVVDLSSAVPRAARHFAVENNGVLDDRRLRLFTEDGRQFLLNSTESYDLAIVDSTHPKSVDSWILYTREFYALVHDRLADGGILVQWLPLHGLSEREFKLIVRTFLGVFEHTTLWASAGFEPYGQVAYAKLVGRRGGPVGIDPAALARRLAEPRIQGDLAPYGMGSVAELLDSYVADAVAVARWTDGLPEQTDDHPLVPYTTELSRGRPMIPALLLGARSHAPPWLRRPSPDGSPPQCELARAYEAQGLVFAGNLWRARELYPQGNKLALFEAQAHTAPGYYASLAERYPSDTERLFEAATQLGALGYAREAKPIYERALRLRPRDERLRLNYGVLLLRLGEVDPAVSVLVALRRERPDSALALSNLGAALMVQSDPAAARALLRESLSWDPDALGTRLALAEAELALGESAEAERGLVELVARNPWVTEAHDLLGLAAFARQQWQLAVEHHRRAVDLDRYRPSFQAHLGRALEALGDWKGAGTAYEASLRLDPDATSVREALGRVQAAEHSHASP